MSRSSAFSGGIGEAGRRERGGVGDRKLSARGTVPERRETEDPLVLSVNVRALRGYTWETVRLRRW